MERTPAITMRHAELIQKLSEFFTLLAQLGSIERSQVKIPSPESPAIIRREAALDAGYTEEVVNLMELLPYITEGPSIWQSEIMPSTELIDYTKCESEGNFEARRDYGDGLDDEHDEPDDLIPGSVLKLTEINLYGTQLLYDTQTCLLIEWKPFENPQDAIGYAHIPAKRPAEVLDPWIEAFRTFKYIHTLSGNMWDGGHSLHASSEPPDHYSPGWKTQWWAARAVEQALWKLKDMYLECGWDVKSQTQDKFDRDRFIQMRTQYMDEVVRPLEETENKISEALRRGDRDEL